MQKLYDSLDRDLIEARKLQQSLIRDRNRDFGTGRAAIMLRPSGHVGGDLVGSFVIDERRIAVFSVDVSGHGVASAMMTARLAGLLSGGSPDQNIALTINADGSRDAFPPHEVAFRLNRMMIEDMQVEQYFTMAYAEIDMINGQVELVAGRASASDPDAAQRADGGLGKGGLPIGLIAGADLRLRFRPSVAPATGCFWCRTASPNARTCRARTGHRWVDRRFLRQSAKLASPTCLRRWCGIWPITHSGIDFPDDVSGLMFDYLGPP